VGRGTTTPSRRLVSATCLAAAAIACSASPSTTTSTPQHHPVSFQERAVLAIGSPSDRAFHGLEPVCRKTEGCPGVAIDPSDDVVAIDRSGNWLHLGPAVITGEDVASARAVQTGGTPTHPVIEWAVGFELAPEGATAFADATAAAVVQPTPRNQIAIVIDGVVIASPVVQTTITDGRGVIAGDYTESVAEALAASIGPVSVSS
jgi:preprotein translocase subunit SecD